MEAKISSMGKCIDTGTGMGLSDIVYVKLLYDMLCFKFEICFKLLLMKNECYMKILNGLCIFLNFLKFEKDMFFKSIRGLLPYFIHTRFFRYIFFSLSNCICISISTRIYATMM